MARANEEILFFDRAGGGDRAALPGNDGDVLKYEHYRGEPGDWHQPCSNVDTHATADVINPATIDEVTFTYTVSDGASTDTATVTVRTAPFILQIAAIESLNYNSGSNTTTTTIDLIGVPNQIYTIDTRLIWRPGRRTRTIRATPATARSRLQ